jgi:hypothetical protein
MQLTSQPIYFSYRFATRPVDDGRSLPVSTSYPDANPWITVPWDEHVENPHEGPDEVTVGGWTFLYGPCVFRVDAAIGVGSAQPLANSHIQMYETDASSGSVLVGREAWEWEVAQKEGNTVHLAGSWTGNLVAGRRLRLRVDYWHATAPAKIFRANVSGLYWRY